MTSNHPEEAPEPTPHQLAAYLDGELEAADARLVETWLARCPEQAADLEAQNRIRHLLAQAAPPDPSEAQWSQVMAGIDAGLTAAPRQRTGRRVSAAVLAVLAFGLTAAGLLLAAWLNRPLTLEDSPAEEARVLVEASPWEVATANDVEINTIDHADLVALVVGEPPVRDAELALATPADVTVDSVEPASDGMWPDMRLLDSPSAPMVAPPRIVPTPKAP